jgi:hypothetical protein
LFDWGVIFNVSDNTLAAPDPGLTPFNIRVFNPPAGPVRFESTIRPADEPIGSFEALFPDRTLPMRPPPTGEFIPRVGTAIRRLTELLRWMLLPGDFCRWPPNFCPPMPDTRGANDGDERKLRETPPDIPPDSRVLGIPEPAIRPLDIRAPDMPEPDMREPENDRWLLP